MNRSVLAGIAIAACVGMLCPAPSDAFQFYYYPRYKLKPYFLSSGMTYHYPFFYYYPDVPWGMSPPFEQGRRQLAVPDISNRPSVVYVVQKDRNEDIPEAFRPDSSRTDSNSKAPWSDQDRPTIIEREKVIIDRSEPKPADQPAAQGRTFYSPSRPVGQSSGFAEQLDQAQQMFRNRQYKEAVEAYHFTVALQPSSPMGKMGQALALFAVGDYEQAASALRKALTLHKEWNATPIQIGTFYGEVNDFYAHLARLERYRKQNRENIEAGFVLAYCYVVLERNNEAAELLATLLESDPNDLEATTLLGYMAAKQY